MVALLVANLQMALLVVTLLMAAWQVTFFGHHLSDEASTLLAFLASEVVALLVTILQLVFLASWVVILPVLLASSVVTLMMANLREALLESSCWWGIYFSGVFGITVGHLVGG